MLNICNTHNAIKFWDLIILVFSKDHIIGSGVSTVAESAAKMVAENVNNLDNFTSAYKVDMAEVASHKKPSSREVILDALNALVGPANDGLLVAYDILIADDHKFMAFMALPKRMKRNLYNLTIVFKDSLHE
ncbi:hypothetical protein ZWY2020_020254 [Hordeum vulgare]|nr:hypothetical protein ZWY2020_020254 [Hordeum vulgare]